MGFLAKRVEPAISLGTLVLAALLADVLWCIFLLTGVESVHFRPGAGAANYLIATHIGFSHSLSMDLLWAGLFAAGYWRLRHSLRGAWIVFAAVLSHWVLDFVSHRPDMPLAPGVGRSYGLGLWTSIPATLLFEGGFWLVAVMLYVRASDPSRRVSRYAFWSIAVLLTLVWYNNIAGPPPPDPRLAPAASLILFTLIVAWAFWMNRAYPVRHLPLRAL